MAKFHRDSLLFHHQVRIGKGGKAIVVSKFRTMKKGAHRGFEQNRLLENDPRVTLFGRILRRTGIDELPQLWNVIKGELHLIGIRTRQRVEFGRLPEEVKQIYKEMGPGLWPIDYACRNFPPTREDLIETSREFHQMWKKSPRRAKLAFFLRSLRNIAKRGGIDRRHLDENPKS